jgi:arylsulfatase
MDGAIGRVLQALRETGREDDTIVLFASDNGGAAEDPGRSLPGAVSGTRESYEGYGLAGAHVSSGPFRKTKRFTHEGGISAPLIARWPAGIDRSLRGKLTHAVAHLIDILPTCLDVADARFPERWNGAAPMPPEGIRLTPLFRGVDVARPGPIFWEHEGGRAVRSGKWKLVASFDEPWELYDMEADRTESTDLAKTLPDIARDLSERYDAWAARAGVKPWPVLPGPAPAAKKEATSAGPQR